MPESNFALESSHIAVEMSSTFGPHEYEVIAEDRDRPGWRTDNDLKALGTRLLQSIIGTSTLRFHKNFFTCPAGENLKKYASVLSRKGFIDNNYYQTAISNAASEARETIRDLAKYDVRTEIINQLKQWSQEKIVSPVTNEVKTKYHGKFGGKPDDLALCLIAAPFLIRKRQNTVNTMQYIYERIGVAMSETERQKMEEETGLQGFNAREYGKTFSTNITSVEKYGKDDMGIDKKVWDYHYQQNPHYNPGQYMMQPVSSSTTSSSNNNGGTSSSSSNLMLGGTSSIYSANLRNLPSQLNKHNGGHRY